jgi:hypothetical protein
MRFVTYEHRKKVAAALRPIYTAPTADAAESELLAFADSPLGRRYPATVATWTNAWERFIPFLAFPPELRRIICTTDEIVNPLLGRAGFVSVGAVFRSFAGSLRSPARSRGQGGAPAAQRGRTTLTPVRTGVVLGGGGRGPTPSRSAGCGAVSLAAPRCPERAWKVAPQWWRPRPPPTCRHRPCG